MVTDVAVSEENMMVGIKKSIYDDKCLDIILLFITLTFHSDLH